MTILLPAVERKKTLGQKLSQGLGRGLDIASQFAQESQQNKLMQQENEAVKKMGFDLTGISDPKSRQEAFKQIAKYTAQKNMINELNLGGGENSPEMPPSDQINAQGETEIGNVKIPTLIPESKIRDMAFINPAVADKMQKHNDNVRSEQRHREGLEQKEIASARKETTPIRKEYADKAKYAKEAIKNKEQQLNLIKKGNVDSPERVFFASLLPGALGNKLLSSDTQLYRAGLFEEFGVLKSMFPGQIRVKEIELLEDKLASLEKSDEAKQKILETGIAKLEIPKIKAKAAQRVEKEHPKATLLEFEELVDRYAQDDLEKAYDNISKAYEKIYFEYAPAESNLVDQQGNIYKNIPKNLLEAFYEEGKKEGLELKPI